jgi:hypothetical protein
MSLTSKSDEAPKVSEHTFFRGQGEDNAFGSFPNHWKNLFGDSRYPILLPTSCAIASRALPTIFVEGEIPFSGGSSNGGFLSRKVENALSFKGID